MTNLEKYNNMKKLNPKITEDEFCLLTGIKKSDLQKEKTAKKENTGNMDWFFEVVSPKWYTNTNAKNVVKL